MNHLTTPTIISVKQFDIVISVELDRSDTNVREMMELFHKALIGHGYHQESIERTIYEMAKEINNINLS